MAERFDAEAVKQKSFDSSAANCSEDDIIHKIPLDNVFHQASCSEDDIIHKLPLENVFHQGHDGTVNIFLQTRDDQSVSGACPDEDCIPPHHALFFALSYLSVQDLLSTEGVCKSLRYTIKTDPLLWRNIHIDQPLNEKMNDDVLIQLTKRAQGYLQSLSLVECSRITDEGLKLVLESNPRLTKLCVPGCTRLSIDRIVDNLKTFSSFDTRRIKYLRIGGVYGVTQKHFDELKLLVASEKNLGYSPKPHFYGRDTYYLPSDDDRSIDIEVCPICQNLRLVYDCPNEDCRGGELSQTCRACTFCIQRCIQCGQCINDSVFVENFCLEYLCVDCWNHLPKQPENFSNKDALSEPDEHGEPSSGFSTHG
uniref:F-box domain-containing protein n=1 Tax=Kalanchoe fedtschenkoi TaxID=63787 RepID=A0A7N0TX61_KALFE